MSPRTTRTLIIAALSLFIAVAAFSLMLYQVHSKERTLQTQLNTLDEEMRREDSYYKLARLAEDSRSDREQLASLFIASESDSISVLNWIEQTAPTLGLSLETKGLQKITDKDTQTDWIEASFSFSGDRANVERFVSVLERLPHLSYVTSASLSARSSTNWEALVTLRVYLPKL